LNLLLLPHLAQIGTAIALIATETVSVTVLFLMSRGLGVRFEFLGPETLRYAGAALFASGAIYAVSLAPLPDLADLPLAAAAGGLVYLGLLRLARDPVVLEFQEIAARNLNRLFGARRG
jgi:O-antigen/teichoic acid export membrane protein